MFEIGWSELLLIAIVAIIVIGPKELPEVMRNFGRMVARLRRSADDFRRQFEESVREAGYDDIQRDLRSMRDLNPANHIRDTLEDAVRQINAPPRALNPPVNAEATASSNAEQANQINKDGLSGEAPSVAAGESAVSPELPKQEPPKDEPLKDAEPHEPSQPVSPPQKNGSAAPF